MSKVVVLDQLQDFATLEEEWEDLHRNAAFATPFQSWAWLYSWWEFYGKDYELRVVTIREGGLLVGLMPLMLERRGAFRSSDAHGDQTNRTSWCCRRNRRVVLDDAARGVC